MQRALQSRAEENTTLSLKQPYIIRPLAKVELRPPSPPILGGECIQSPPGLGDLGGIPAFMQEVYLKL